jgi:SOS response regulatory protein OraA/RecX
MYIESELIKKWKPLIKVKRALLEKWVEKKIIEELLDQKKEEIEDWIVNKIKKEIEKLKHRWKDGFDIIQILLRRGYRFSDIKKVLNND